MIVEHEGRAPRIAASAYVAPTAVVAGDVEIGEEARILFGAVVTAEGAPVRIGARIGAGAEVRIHGVVHVRSVLPPEGLVPIGWIAVGDPAEVLAPREHERIWAIQQELDFPSTVFGLPRAPATELMPEATRRYAERFGRHRDDRVVG